MPVEFEVDHENGLVVTTLIGRVSTQESLAHIEHLVKNPRDYPHVSYLTDLRRAEHQASGEDIRKISESLSAHEEVIAGRKLAIVVSQPVMYGMMRMLELRLDAAPLDVAVFYEMDDAKRWLGVEP